MSYYWRMGTNRTSLPDALWFIYMVYLNGVARNFKEAVTLYERGARDPFAYISPSKEYLTGMDFIKKYLVK